MNSRRAFVRRLIFAPAGAGLSLLAMGSLAGCGDQTEQPKAAPPGNREDSRGAEGHGGPAGHPPQHRDTRRQGQAALSSAWPRPVGMSVGLTPPTVLILCFVCPSFHARFGDPRVGSPHRSSQCREHRRAAAASP